MKRLLILITKHLHILTHKKCDKHGIPAIFIAFLKLPAAGLEPARGDTTTDFESASSAIPTRRHMQISLQRNTLYHRNKQLTSRFIKNSNNTGK